MRFLLRLLLGTVICLSVTTLRAQDDDKPKDAEGCKDSPLVTRISQCPTTSRNMWKGSITRGIASPAKAPVKFRYFAIFKQH
jgi:hypothetical protein